MEAHGLVLARRHQVATRRSAEWLLPRLADNERVILDVCRALMAAGRRGAGTTPAGEWLLDNLYLIEEHIRIANKDFPKGYSRELAEDAFGLKEGEVSAPASPLIV